MIQTGSLKTCLIFPQEQTDLKDLKNPHLEIAMGLIANHSYLLVQAGPPTRFSTWPSPQTLGPHSTRWIFARAVLPVAEQGLKAK